MPPKKVPYRRSRKSTRGRGRGGARTKNHIMEEISEVNKPIEKSCGYCQRRFFCREFCEEHEQVCPKGPTSNSKVSFDHFMGLLELVESQSAANTNAAVDQISPQPLPVGENNHQDVKTWMKIFSKNPIPITSRIGMNLVSEYGGQLQSDEDTLWYEKYCGTERLPQETVLNNAIVTKRKIYKRAIDCHLYTNPKSRYQRLTRNEEIVFGFRITNIKKKYSTVIKNTKSTSGSVSSPNASVGPVQRKRSKRIAQKRNGPALEVETVNLATYRNLR